MPEKKPNEKTTTEKKMTKAERYEDDAKNVMVKRVGDTEFRPVGEIAAEDQELADAMKSSSTSRSGAAIE